MTDHPTNPTRQRRPHEAEDPEYLRISAQLDADLFSVWSSTSGRTLDNQLCFLFLRYVGRFNFCNYIGQRVDLICKCLRTVIQALRCLESSGLNKLKAHLRDGVPLDLTWIDLLGDPMANASKVFIVHIRDNSVSAELVDQTISQWSSLALTALEVLEPQVYVRVPTGVQRGPPTVTEPVTYLHPVKSDDLEICQRRVSFVAPLFEDDPVKSHYISKYALIRRKADEKDECIQGDKSKRFVFPAQFICAPSGSGKTTLAHNICCGKYPVLYGLFSYSFSGSLLQEAYLPFVNFSKRLKRVTRNDVRMLDDIDPIIQSDVDTDDLMLTDTIRNNGDVLKYSLVGFLVSFFTQLVDARRSNPSTAYLELQCKIETVDCTPMTINDGFERLKELLVEVDLDSEPEKLPLIFILDECTFESVQSADESKRCRLIRNVCRCLQVMVVLMGTDARAISMIGSTGSGGSGLEQPEWMVVGFETPVYDKHVLERKVGCLRTKFANLPDLKKIVEFVKSVASSEVPWLVDLCLDFLQETDIVDPWVALRGMFLKCSSEFTTRKRRSVNRQRFLEYFANAQVHYMTYFYWQRVESNSTSFRISIQGEEEYINKHLARLFAYPEVEGCPFFVLSVEPENRVYSRDNRIVFTPFSAFTSFRDSPLTGLTLFIVTQRLPFSF